ncbi:unnamed protein product [Cercopithifilaria johnstoni]|uniref:Uncharacterized protein n=1 Tax=Cercopithifilaria johnstoni TaxID=2874296 RepID=A0A8J2Q031_9BILA|nr:unnamed protein product [Cercopithifilaria johnstoni]
MMIIKPSILFLAFVTVVHTLQNPLISAPFDNFRIECAKSSGAVRISARMVGSQGFIRHDIVLAIVCERVDELYPWHNVPTGIAELEREDCYYSHLFDPIVDTESLYTCRPREYISGITRLSDTRVQVLCCRLRTRDETNCKEKEFAKPIGSDPRTEVYHRNQLINSIAVEGNNYRVRFCDLTPRAIGLIYDDLLVTAAITTEIPKNEERHSSKTESNMMNTAAIENKAHIMNGLFGHLTSQATTVPSSATKYVIQIFRPSSLYNFEKDQKKRNMSTLSPSKNNHSQDIKSSLEVQRTSGAKFSTIMNTVVKDGDRSVDWMTDGINKQNSIVPTVSFIPTSASQQFQNHSAASKEVISSDRSRTTAKLSYIDISSPQTTTSASLILLKPLSSKAQQTEVTSRNKQLTTKTSTRRRMKETSIPTISPTSFMTMSKLKTIPTRLKEFEHAAESHSLSSSQLHRDPSSGPHVDEETKFSPFDNRENNPLHNNKAFGSDYSLSLTSASPLDMTTSVESGGFSYKISNEIRRAPIKSHVGVEYTEYDLPIKKSADGSRIYVPENHEPLNAPSATIIYDAGKKNNVSGSEKKKKKKVQQRIQETELKDDISKKLLPMNDDKINLIPTDTYNLSSVKPLSTVSSEQDDLKFPATNFNHTEKTLENAYNPAKFYRTPPPKRRTQTEKVLTFCTKEIAIRDRYNLVIACGSETEIWQPFRCPEGSECFFSADSSYRICCAVAEAVHYAQ